MSDIPLVHRQIDARDLYCPEPVMLLHKAVRDVGEGQLIELLATDPSTQRDVPKFCHFLGHELLKQEQQETLFRFVIRKKNTSAESREI
jgi:tRNA 2-thiouridine synthesizing protein A